MLSRSTLLSGSALPGAIALLAATGAAYLALTQGERGYVVRLGVAEDVPDVPPDIAGAADLPLVVIDPGHGGHDPGASGAAYAEKDIVLGLALALGDRLVADGAARVALTRNDDSYLLHGERFGIARRLGADLFVSIHADSAGEQDDVTGASVYTLSDEASDQAAARFAARENASDRLNGVDLSDQSAAVGDILVELSQRRMQARSDEFARLILREGEGVLVFHKQPRRAAALQVLRAPDVPSVLYEAGYITNAADAERLASAAGRARFAEVLTSAVRIYFARRANAAQSATPAP